MPAPVDPAKLQAEMLELGVMPNELQMIQRLPLESGRGRLEELKERVRKNYKRLAFELHPDRTQNDTAKTERFKLIGNIRDEIEKLQLVPRPQMRPRPFVPVQQNVRVIRVVAWASGPMGHPTANSASTTTSSVSFNIPFRVATMRPT